VEMDGGYQVKGSTIKSKLAFVADRFGAAARDELTEPLRARGLLPILDGSWYPFDLYVEVLRAIADRFYGGDRARLEEIGAYSAEKALTTTYRAFATGKGFFDFLDRLALLHGQFYNLGEMRVERRDAERACDIVLTGAPTYPQEDVYIASGFYAGAGRYLGFTDVVVEIRREGAGVRFLVRGAGAGGREAPGA